VHAEEEAQVRRCRRLLERRCEQFMCGTSGHVARLQCRGGEGVAAGMALVALAQKTCFQRRDMVLFLRYMKGDKRCWRGSECPAHARRVVTRVRRRPAVCALRHAVEVPTLRAPPTVRGQTPAHRLRQRDMSPCRECRSMPSPSFVRPPLHIQKKAWQQCGPPGRRRHKREMLATSSSLPVPAREERRGEATGIRASRQEAEQKSRGGKRQREKKPPSPLSLPLSQICPP